METPQPKGSEPGKQPDQENHAAEASEGWEDFQKTTLTGTHNNDGSLVINFGEKDMEARADFIPPIGEGQPLTPDYIAANLERMSITYGVDWDLIQEKALECNMNRHTIRDIVIARGDPPTEQVHEYYELDPQYRSWPNLPDVDAIKVDWRTISPFIVVKKNQALAQLKPKVDGREGKDIHGKPIPMPIRRPESAVGGTNTRTNNDAIVAACEGRLTEKGKELAVEEVLALKGTVGYKTGHIVFPGDVIIDGLVADGFKVYSGGSILSKQTFDATDVIAKKDLVIAGGLIGRGRASIRVGGTLRAKFLQNCHVLCRGPIIVSAAVTNSQIYTLQKLDLGDKGTLVGGEVFAVQGMRAAALGREGGKATKVHCGIDFTAQQELDRLNQRLQVLSQQSIKLNAMIADQAAGEEKKKKAAAYIQKIHYEQTKIGNRIGELLQKLNVNEGATVEISGEVAAGSLIEICHIALFTEQALRKVRFRLDKNQGKLVHESL